MYQYSFSVTRKQVREMSDGGFCVYPKVLIRRIIGLDKIILDRPKVITRRRTMGSLPETPKATKAIPQLVPLRSMLKQPAQVPFNIRGRKSMFASVNLTYSTPKPSSPSLVKGTTVKMILARANQQSPQPTPSTSSGSTTNRPQTVQPNHPADTTLSPISSPDGSFGRLQFSDSD